MLNIKRYAYRALSLVTLASALINLLNITTVNAGRPSTDSSGNTPEEGNKTYVPVVTKRYERTWAMPGADNERSSWIAEQVDGNLDPLWYKKFEPYIPPNVQIITAYDTLYISTSAGLYALDSESGAEKWVYPTALPLGNSPTIDNGVAYVGGLDHRLHAINAQTGEGLWTFEAGSGFSTNPLIINGVAYLGNRDGYFYAIRTAGPSTGQLAWKYQTAGPIEYSAAYKDGVLFFASNDSYAYALRADTGSLVWKSDKLPGMGFQSWWPVVYREWVVFAGSSSYRTYVNPGISNTFMSLELHDVYPNRLADPRGVPVGPIGVQAGDWVDDTCTINTSQPTVTQNGSTVPVTEYLESKPWRRTYIVLNRFTGDEYTTDFDQDGRPEYAPILYQGANSGNRYPPVVGRDGVIYQATSYMSDPYIAGGQIVGWKIGTPFISIPSSGWQAVDEPLAYSMGGNRIYWNLCCDREAGSIDVSTPNPNFPPDWLLSNRQPCSDAPIRPGREVTYFSYNLPGLIPGYSSRYYPDQEGWSTFGGRNGAYGPHGNQNPPIPYHGKLFVQRSNAIIALAPDAGAPVELPMALIVSPPQNDTPAPNLEQIQARLAQEVDKMIAAGHLRPAFYSAGSLTHGASVDCGYNNLYNLGDYWYNPADTIYVLTRALPYLSGDLYTRTVNYLRSEFTSYPPYQVTHVGWKTGAAREVFDWPPEVVADAQRFPAWLGDEGFDGWFYNPYGFYSMWKYADIFRGDANFIFNSSSHLLNTTPPSDSYLQTHVEVLNSYIAGYYGYLNLQVLAGYAPSSDIQSKLDHLLNLRVSTFTKDIPDTMPGAYKNNCRGLNMTRNFIYLTPELAQELREHALDRVQAALNEYTSSAPYWFVSRFNSTFGEGADSALYNYYSLFQAKGLILQEPWEALAKYIDVPAVAIGDLFYIDNLVTTLQAAGQ